MLMQILDVMIGLTVVYLIFSTVASASLELVEAMVRKRGQLLLRGIDELFKAVAGHAAGKAADRDEFLLAFYASPHVSALFGGRLEKKADADAQARATPLDRLRGTSPALADQRFTVLDGRLPSYIPADRFAAAIQAMASVAVDAPESARKIAELSRRIVEVASQLNLPASAAGISDALEIQRHKLAAFFEGSADRITGWYRRRVQWLLLIVGLILAGSFNLDTVRIAKVLSEDPVLRSQLVEQALQDVRDQGEAGFVIGCKAAVPEVPATAPAADTVSPADEQTPSTADDCESQLRAGIDRRLRYANSLGLPIGWDQDPLVARWRDGKPDRWLLVACLIKLLGCLLTALAICMGAPFWFDLLNQLANIRTAIKPPPPPPAPATPPKP